MSRPGLGQFGHINRFTVARQNVWQVLDQRPSRLAHRMAVREMTVTRCVEAVKTYAKGGGLTLNSHKNRVCRAESRLAISSKTE